MQVSPSDQDLQPGSEVGLFATFNSHGFVRGLNVSASNWFSSNTLPGHRERHLSRQNRIKMVNQ